MSAIMLVAKDACACLGLSNVSLAVNGNPTSGDLGLDDDEKGIRMVQTAGGPQKLLCVSEPGLYSLIFKSRKPEAKAFQRWVTHEVLPEIRKTGQYAMSSAPGGYADALEDLARDVRKADSLTIDAPRPQTYTEALRAHLHALEEKDALELAAITPATSAAISPNAYAETLRSLAAEVEAKEALPTEAQSNPTIP